MITHISTKTPNNKPGEFFEKCYRLRPGSSLLRQMDWKTSGVHCTKLDVQHEPRTFAFFHIGISASSPAWTALASRFASLHDL